MGNRIMGRQGGVDPRNAIVPLLALSGGNAIGGFLGTAAFVGAPNRLLTDEHVVRNWDHEFGIVAYPDITSVHQAVFVRDDDRNLALLETTNFVVDMSLERAESNMLHNNSQIVCLEYGTTRATGEQISFSPATRLGNVT